MKRIVLSRVVLGLAFVIALAMPWIQEARSLEIDGRHISKVCGTVPHQPEVLPITGESLNVISAHNLKVTVWLECARGRAKSEGDWNLIQTVEHAHSIWVLEGHKRVAEHFPGPPCLQEDPPSC